MFHVVTCSKYSRKTIRVVSCEDVDAMMNGDMGECILCGPCSHVEIGPRKNYWEILYSCDTEDEAAEFAWLMIDMTKGGIRLQRLYDTSYLPERKEEVVA